LGICDVLLIIAVLFGHYAKNETFETGYKPVPAEKWGWGILKSKF